MPKRTEWLANARICHKALRRIKTFLLQPTLMVCHDACSMPLSTEKLPESPRIAHRENLPDAHAHEPKCNRQGVCNRENGAV